MIKNGILTFKNLSSYPEIIHGFSTRRFGNLENKDFSKENQNLDDFLGNLGVEKKQLVMAKQLHSGQMDIVGKTDGGRVISKVDGLITQDRGIFLGVNVADCLPLLFYNSFKKIVASCHAGWRGTLKEITKETVEKMVEWGSRPQEIMVGIGPHIKACCYNVSEGRIKVFRERFGDDRKMVAIRDGSPYLDLTYINIKQLVNAGLEKENIEVSPFCTFCDGSHFFSYRRHGGKSFPEMLGVIGMRR